MANTKKKSGSKTCGIVNKHKKRSGAKKKVKVISVYARKKAKAQKRGKDGKFK
jgi:hypothetical protein